MPGVAAVAAALAVLSADPARAADASWTNSGGGLWSAPGNWSTNAVPGPSDRAIIDLAGTYGARALRVAVAACSFVAVRLRRRPVDNARVRLPAFLILVLLLLGTPSWTAVDAAMASGAPAQAPLAMPMIAIQPLGELDPELARGVAAHLRGLFAAEVVVLPAKELPRSAHNPVRRRYRGERLIDWLEAEAPAGVARVLGLMRPDLAVRKGKIPDWGVMGVAKLAGRAGVVSVHRLGRRGASASQVERRARQVAAHEFGHTLGLDHCPVPRCIMNDARGGIGAVDRSSEAFCERCRRRLAGWARS